MEELDKRTQGYIDSIHVNLKRLYPEVQNVRVDLHSFETEFSPVPLWQADVVCDPGKDHGRTTFTMIDPDKTEAVHRLSSWIRSQARVQEKWEK
jgi:hypothetical protein